MFILLILAMLVNWSGAETIERIMSKIDDPNVSSIEAMLPLLDQDFRDSFTLMKRSGSLQQASARNPRAIMFGRDGRLLGGFNACPAQRGFDSVELIQFRTKTDSFEFRQIKARSDARLEMSGVNPKRCLACHGSDPRPIWLPYQLWSSPLHEAFGFNDDNVEDDLADYESFRAEAKTNVRFRALGGTRHRERWPYVRPGEKLKLADRPNLRLSVALNHWNARWVAARVMKRPFVALAYLVDWVSSSPQSSVETLLPYLPSLRLPRSLIGPEKYAFILGVLMKEAGLDRTHMSLEFRATEASLEEPFGYWDGSNSVRELIAHELWHRWSKTPRQKVPEYLQRDPLKQTISDQLPALLAALDQYYCAERLAGTK